MADTELREKELTRASKRLIVLRTNTRRLSLLNGARHREGCYEAGLSTARQNAELLAGLQSKVQSEV